MIRRLLAVPALALAALLVPMGTTAAHVPGPAGAAATATTAVTSPSSDTTEVLPGTTLEAEDRHDNTAPAPWLIGSGIAAAAAVAIGGQLLKRRAG
jgi:hypothetical protein